MTPTSTDEHPAAIDPRLRARRSEVQRREGRRRLHRLVVVLGVLSAGGGAAAIALSPLLDVDRVVVRGATVNGTDPVHSAAGIVRGEPMATLDVQAARIAIEAVPWVDTASVQRSWPGTVVIAVTERRAVAAVRTAEGSWALVDADRRQLSVVGTGEIADLPRIEGLSPPAGAGSELVPDAAGALELASLLSGAMPADEFRVMVAVDDSLEVVVERPSRAEVRALFGRPDRLADKVVALVTLLDENEVKAGPARIDVRVPGAPVLTRAAQ